MDRDPNTVTDELWLPLSNRARRFGYIIWPKKREEQVSDLLDAAERISVVWDGVELGEKRVDYKHCRISVGRRALAGVPDENATLSLTVDGGVLHVQVR